jgi:predicted nucleotidyltransferase
LIPNIVHSSIANILRDYPRYQRSIVQYLDSLGGRKVVKNTKELKIINTVNRITTTVEKIPNLKLLILFGSRARGEHRPDSDWDLAISYDETNRQTGIKEISNDYLTSLYLE